MNRWKVWTAVFTAVVLIASGGAFARNSNADAALFKAAKSGSVEGARAAIQAGADVDAKKDGCSNYDEYYDDYDSDCGKTPLFLAISGGNARLVEMLLETGASVTAEYGGWSPLHNAATNSGNAEIVKVLINAGANVNAKTDEDHCYGEYCGWTPLMCAASSNENIEILKVLINAGADINAASKRGWTPLTLAAKNNKNIEVVKVLINAGADVNSRNKDSWTPLMWAARDNENVEITRALINAGADVNASSDFGWTPLILAARSNENLEVAKALLEAGATAAPAIGGNETVVVKLTSAISSRDLERFKVLIAAGADVNARAIECNTYSNRDECLEYSRYSRDYSYHYRFYDGDYNGNGQTLLHFAASKGSAEVVKMLLEAGADVNAKEREYRCNDDNCGRTPLHVAASKGNAEIVKMLLEAGADKTIRDAEDKTAADYVKRGSAEGTRIYWMLK